MPVIRGAAGLSRYLDGLSRFRDHWLNAGSVRISNRITVVSVVISVVQTLADPNLSVADRIANLLGIFIVTIAIAISILAMEILAYVRLDIPFRNTTQY